MYVLLKFFSLVYYTFTLNYLNVFVCKKWDFLDLEKLEILLKKEYLLEKNASTVQKAIS